MKEKLRGYEVSIDLDQATVSAESQEKAVEIVKNNLIKQGFFSVRVLPLN